MTASFSADEIRELASTVGSVCQRHCTEDRVREVAYAEGGPHGGFDRQLWSVLCEQVGVAALMLPEAHGGLEAGAVALGAIAEQLGRSLAPVPFLASAVLATGLLVEAAPQSVLDAWLPSLLDGSKSAAAVVSPDGGLWRADAVSVSASPDGTKLTGVARHVLHGGAADLLIVVAHSAGSLQLFAVDPAEAGVTITVESTLDATRPMATVEFAGASATHLNAATNPAHVIDRNINRAIAVLSAEQVGALARVLEITSDYARTREQFGRPIGSFQAVKHACSNVLVNLEWSRSASQDALEAIDADLPDAAWHCSMAKAVCSESFRDATSTNIQLHGGIGFTWENSAHLFFKRARTDEVIFGSPGQHWTRMSDESPALLTH